MKLSDFKDEKAVEVIAKLLVPIGNIANNVKNAEAKEQGALAFASALLANNASDVKDMFAILNDEDPKDYHCNGATVLGDTIAMLSDAPLMELFGLRSQTQTSSGSASETGEVKA